MHNTDHFQTLLEQERTTLLKELASLGQINSDNAEDWELAPADLDIMEADRNEAADRIEEQQIEQGVLDNLEVRYRLVLHAIKRIKEGTYGICEIGGEKIEEDRLEVNPAARTCKAHMEEESTLTL